MIRRITPDMPPEVAHRVVREEAGDLKARMLLIDLSERAFFSGEAEGRRAAATLIHAAVYLENRVQYMCHPWPKNMIRIPFSDGVA